MADALSQNISTKLPQLLSKSTPLSEAMANWEQIKTALNSYGIFDEANLLGMLATVLVETAHTLRPIKEFGNQHYFKHNYWDNQKTAKALGNIVETDAWEYCGRGYIQVTGRSNYEQIARELNLPLMSCPALMETPAVSANAAAFWWKAHGVDKLCNAAGQSPPASKQIHWEAVRRRVNGGINGLTPFLHDLRVLGGL